MPCCLPSCWKPSPLPRCLPRLPAGCVEHYAAQLAELLTVTGFGGKVQSALDTWASSSAALQLHNASNARLGSAVAGVHVAIYDSRKAAEGAGAAAQDAAAAAEDAAAAAQTAATAAGEAATSGKTAATAAKGAATSAASAATAAEKTAKAAENAAKATLTVAGAALQGMAEQKQLAEQQQQQMAKQGSCLTRMEQLLGQLVAFQV